jgi:Protein of unknown function (DUF3122).
MLGCRVRQFFSRLLLLGALVLSVFLGLGIVTTPQASATIRQLEEAPGQVVYQSRETLKDQQENTWQAIAFKRILPNGKTSLELRLVGFPGMVEIDHTQPLLLTNSMGKTLTAADISSRIFTDPTNSESNVAQYDLQPLLTQLQVEIPLKLTLPTRGGEAINLSVPPSFVQEWQTLFSSKD